MKGCEVVARLTKQQLDELMKKENVSRLWSWSRIHCFQTSMFEYYLKYVKHEKEDRQNCIYVVTGGLCHDIIEKYYTGQINYDDMINEFEDGFLVAYDIAQLKFDRNDEEKDKRIGVKYYECLQHFFKNHKPLEYKPAIEKFIKIRVGSHLLNGYVDCCFKDGDGVYHIVDWKSSSIYRGRKMEEECGQLALYALGLHQAGIPLENIRICWDFLKYCTIQYEQKNGAIKIKDVERNKIGESLQTNSRMWLKSAGYSEEETDEYLKMLLNANSIEVLPKEIQEKYTISDCFVYVPLTQELIDKWVNVVETTIRDIYAREIDYEKTKNPKCFWDDEESVRAQEYYYAVLCAYSPNKMLPYKEYLDKLEAQKNGQNLFGGLLGDSVKSKNDAKTSKDICDNTACSIATRDNNNNDDDEDLLSWLDDIL